MPVILALVGICIAVYLWTNRARTAAHAASDLADMANDVRLAARRIGFKRRTNIHPAESIEDPNLAIAGIAIAFVELDDFPTQEHRAALNVQLRATTRVDQDTADEMVVLGRWLVTECGGPSAAISRLARKLHRLDATAHARLTTVVTNTVQSQNALNQRQTEALVELQTIFRTK